MSDTTLVKVSSKGLVTLPKKIRTDLDIHDGDYLTISSDKDRIIFRKGKDRGRLREPGRCLEGLREEQVSA